MNKRRYSWYEAYIQDKTKSILFVFLKEILLYKRYKSTKIVNEPTDHDSSIIQIIFFLSHHPYTNIQSVSVPCPQYLYRFYKFILKTCLNVHTWRTVHYVMNTAYYPWMKVCVFVFCYKVVVRCSIKLLRKNICVWNSRAVEISYKFGK